MGKLIQVAIFLGWIATLVWTCLELDKIDFLEQLITGP
jgi:hypothetical protein